MTTKLAKLGKAAQDTYNWKEWLILKALLKNWVAEGVASEVNDYQLPGTNHLM